MVSRSGNTQPHQAQQRLRDSIGPARLKRGRIRVFTPDAVKLRQDAVTENIEKTLQRLMPFPALGDVIQIRRRQRRINAIHPHKSGANNRRFTVVLFIVFGRLQYDNQAVKQIDVGVERKEPAQHFTEQADVAAPGKTMAIERYFNLHAAYQITLLEAFRFAVFHINDGLQATTVHFTVCPLIQRKGPTQHVSIIHHRQKSTAEMAQYAPVETIPIGWIARQRRGAEVTHANTDRGGFHHRIKHGTLQRPAWQLAVSAGERQRQAFIFRHGVVVKGFAAENKPGVMQTGRPATHAGVVVILRCLMTHHSAFVAEA